VEQCAGHPYEANATLEAFPDREHGDTNPTLALRDRACRCTNAVVVTWGMLSAPGAVVAGLSGVVGAGVNVIALFATLVGLLILWHVWKWPVEKRREGVKQSDPVLAKDAAVVK
jgi:Flp pilus assembly protein TadB